MILPSKELFEDVTSYEVKAHHYGLHGDNVEFAENRSINAYKLMHMMKEWAKLINISISSETKPYGYLASLSSMSGGSVIEELNDLSINRFDNNFNLFTANTEVEAVAKACEWILNESV